LDLDGTRNQVEDAKVAFWLYGDLNDTSCQVRGAAMNFPLERNKDKGDSNRYKMTIGLLDTSIGHVPCILSSRIQWLYRAKSPCNFASISTLQLASNGYIDFQVHQPHKAGHAQQATTRFRASF
jgi:hypothetical protein